MKPTLLRFACLALGCLLAAAGCARRQTEFERRLVRGDEMMAAGKFDEAEEEYKRALLEQPKDARVLSRLGRLAFRQGRTVTGYFLLQGTSRELPDDLDHHLAFGLASHALAHTSDARNAAKKVLEGRPTDEEALILLAETCLTSRDNQEARRLVQAAMARERETAGHRVALSILHLVQNEEAEAEREVRRALELDAQSSAAHSQLANLHLHRKDAAQAAEALQRAAALAPARAPRRIRYIELLVRSGKADDARRELASLLEKAPDYVPARVALMKLDFQQDRLDDSLAGADLVLARDRANYDALMQRAAIKLLRSDFDGVIADLKTTEGFYERTPEVKYQLALAYLQKNETALAEQKLQQVLRLSPHHDEAVLQLADLQLQKGDRLSTITALSALLERRPQEPRAYPLLAQARQANGEPELALEVLQKMAASFPRSAIAPYQIGLLQVGLGRLGEARSAFERAVAINAGFWPAMEMLVNLDVAEQDLAAAVRRVGAVVEAQPDAVAPLLLRAKVRILAGEIPGAEADLLKAVELEPKTHRAYLLLARIFAGTDRGAAGIERLEALVAQRPSAPSQMQLGMLHQAMDHPAEARAAYERALALDARFSPALNNLALLCAEQFGQLDEAADLAKRAFDLAPEDPIVADTYGWVLFRRRQFDPALRLLQAAAAKAPADPEIQYHLGMIQYFLGLDELARATFRNVLASNPGPRLQADARLRLDILSLDPATADATARRRLEEALRGDPADSAALVRLAAIEAHAGAHSAAAGHYEEALKVNARAVPVMLALAELYLGPLPNGERGRELARQAHALVPSDLQVSWRLGRMLHNAGEFAWAATLLQEAALPLADNPEFQYDLARSQYSLGRVADATATLKRLAGARAPDAVRQAATRLATLIAGAGPDGPAESALAEARQALAADANHVPALYLVALQQEREKDHEAARRTYERILELQPLFAPATRQLAVLYAEQFGDDRRGEELALAAMKSLPEDAELNYQMGVINYRRSDYVAAVRFLQQSARTRARHAGCHFFLGLAQFQLKANAEARSSLQRALELGLPPQETAEANRVLGLLGGGSRPRN